jgi:hypothetical protein
MATRDNEWMQMYQRRVLERQQQETTAVRQETAVPAEVIEQRMIPLDYGRRTIRVRFTKRTADGAYIEADVDHISPNQTGAIGVSFDQYRLLLPSCPTLAEAETFVINYISQVLEPPTVAAEALLPSRSRRQQRVNTIGDQFAWLQ